MNRIILAMVIFLAIQSIAIAENNPSELRFSNTQQWSSTILHLIKTWNPVWISLSDQDKQKLSPPPNNNSKTMAIEVEELLQLQIKRSSKDVKLIKREMGICGWNMDGFIIGSNKEIDGFLIDIFFDVTHAGYKLKKEINRVRPSHYDKRIKPSIPVPNHAAYPSNHSIQTHMLALNLADIFPNKKRALLKAAHQITRNREIAGVHYASDSKIGKLVAMNLHQKLITNKKYQNKVIKLQKKYKNNNKLFEAFTRENYSTCKGYIRGFREGAGLNL